MIENTEQTRRQNIEQHRGHEAWEDILEIKKLGDKEQKEYRALARGLNAMIQINGLGQTLGFLKANFGMLRDPIAHWQTFGLHQLLNACENLVAPFVRPGELRHHRRDAERLAERTDLLDHVARCLSFGGRFL